MQSLNLSKILSNKLSPYFPTSKFPAGSHSPNFAGSPKKFTKPRPHRPLRRRNRKFQLLIIFFIMYDVCASSCPSVTALASERLDLQSPNSAHSYLGFTRNEFHIKMNVEVHGVHITLSVLQRERRELCNYFFLPSQQTLRFAQGLLRFCRVPAGLPASAGSPYTLEHRGGKVWLSPIKI